MEGRGGLLCSEWRYLRANTRGIIRYRETEGKLGISCGQLDINMGKTGQKLGKNWTGSWAWK